MKLKDAADDFLTSKRIAVTGVSRTPGSHGGNVVYQRLRERGYEVFAVNPNAEQVEGDPAFADLSSIPGGVDAVVVATAPKHADETVREACELGVTKIWMHRSIDAGSVSDTATRYGREHGATVIDGGCPLMFGAASDGGHRMMCRVLTLFGRVPRQV
ncbi:CoA-binding protein [Actinotalea sp. M2MS4P-6]|uniref:CoA-binding protein n=1 Tax=Actinotalea sp. M2MS4P-6 TaxID=2983762 RepID=UPI0021E4BDC5|nr:CoA-binding protein [Actinotalea sp. M2MS4P-6]MCV2392959.1 CoA-binding protein [Actinotalea sp. M2MS4P-6]